MSGEYEWDFGNKVNILLANVSEYDPFKAFYELTKNSEEASASCIRIHFDYDHSRIVVYDDGEGMSINKLLSLSKGIGTSDKDLKHHGVGLMGFMRISKKMVLFSKKGVDRNPSILSCTIWNDKIVSDVGNPREATNAEQIQYAFAANMLHRSNKGTVIVLEEVGKYQTSHYDFHFDFKETFEQRKFEAFFRKEAEFKLKEFSYFIKYGNGKPHKLSAKLGQGRHYRFSIPSKEHPFLTPQGHPRAVFSVGEHSYELKVDFDIWISSAHTGNIGIAENRQNFLPTDEVLKHCSQIPRSSVYINHEYHRYLQGMIDFKIKPLNGAPEINVYTGSRTQLLMQSNFGNALANVLIAAEVDVLKPAVQEYISKQESQKDEARSREVQEDLENFLRANKEFFNFISTESIDVVSTRNYVRCNSCGTMGLPVRGKVSTETVPQAGKIYAFEDKDVYVCGQCGHQWQRKKYTPPDDEQKRPDKPLYSKPKGSESTIRQRKHGFGFTIAIRPFGSDPRRTRVVGTTVEINSSLDDYKKFKKQKGAFGNRLLGIYERQQALQAMIEHESKPMSKEEVTSKLREADSRILVWNVDKTIDVQAQFTQSQFTIEDLKQKFQKEA